MVSSSKGFLKVFSSFSLDFALLLICFLVHGCDRAVYKTKTTKSDGPDTGPVRRIVCLYITFANYSLEITLLCIKLRYLLFFKN